MNHIKEELTTDYWFESVSLLAYQKIYADRVMQVFEPDLDLDLGSLLSASELAAKSKLQQNLGQPFSLNLILYCGDEIIGWMHGRQESDEKFYMVNSGIKKEHRNKGLYKKMLKRVLEIVLAEGFQIIVSKHAATNNAVIVPKLKQGFVISGFEISDTNGILVVLSYFHNPVRRQAMDFRVGFGLPGSDLLAHLPDLRRD